MRLDEDRLDALRRWGHALQGADSEEFAAAGRGILMLIEEIELLRFELLRTREQLSRANALSSDEAAEEMEEPVASTLHERLQRVLGGDSDSSPESRSDPVEGAVSGMEGERATISPQSWIESLRRQK
ncbi:MAG TPA: hypothetical protein VIM33_11630 [Gaiellaceae bacterium]|jgi:hypothetical protein